MKMLPAAPFTAIVFGCFAQCVDNLNGINPNRRFRTKKGIG
jgi:hypothetical protein